jgi:hypothetical protein
VNIRFKPDEGGLNLAMRSQMIESIVDRGRRAGEKLREEFEINQVTYIRFQLVMALMESQLAEIEAAYRNGPPLSGQLEFTEYKDLIAHYQASLDNGAQNSLEDTDRIIEKIKAVIEELKRRSNDLRHSTPASQLRVTPRY